MSIVEYNLAFSRRKTIALQVKAGQVFVRAPYGISQAYIEKLLRTKQSWIEAKLEQSKLKQLINPALAERKNILIFGQYYPLNIQSQRVSEQVRFADGKLSVYLTSNKNQQDKTVFNEEVEALVKTWLHAQTSELIKQKLAHWCQITELLPASYKVRYYKSKWGSCNSRKALTFNSLLAMTPDYVVDYIVVHELCHLVHLNHSSQFWQLVECYIPNVKSAKTWLKEHQQDLTFH
ncbi:M48 family metallopeptidase [Endozoicomonas sp. G2_1]|uniref:M48 family metallopeptidase n=1 Tax=Endozoicomonas sp. G2_1 TaxID=2821091 RepID=UPI001ADCFF1D|nr:SprT family zinc-dependent metalloprotease [Endozoicomonas sp. G2_1]MBO9489490.1 M48 family metallopeptidase [Endozoicomonas sp. G2_1]